MQMFKANLPTILLLVFEVVAGILLLVKPESFTMAVIILFGVILLIMGVSYLIRYLRETESSMSKMISLAIAVASLIVGAVCTFGANAITNFFTIVAIIYGAILIVSGICKLSNYIEAAKEGLPVSKVNIISGIAAIILGVAVLLFPQSAVSLVFRLTGIALIAEAVIDLAALVLAFRIASQEAEE